MGHGGAWRGMRGMEGHGGAIKQSCSVVLLSVVLLSVVLLSVGI